MLVKEEVHSVIFLQETSVSFMFLFLNKKMKSSTLSAIDHGDSFNKICGMMVITMEMIFSYNSVTALRF